MKIIYGLEHLEKPAGRVALTIGNFDGVHIGHQAIIASLVEHAHKRNYTSVVMTFEFHPLRLINPLKAPAVLMSLSRRLEIIEQFGVDIAVIAHCTESLLNMSREEFVSKILVEHFQLGVIVEGENFRFGHQHRGNIDYLHSEGKRFGFDTIKIPARKIEIPEYGKQTISSTLIRLLVQDGRVDLAEKCLGRRYELIGTVVAGAGRGKGLGFPTANLQCGELMLPKQGVYACKAYVGGKSFLASANIGPAPTFNQYRTGVEVHIIDFEGKLYGSKLRLEFYQRIRDIRRFTDITELRKQVADDIKQTKNVVMYSGRKKDFIERI